MTSTSYPIDLPNHPIPEDRDMQAIKHVFINLIGMDKISFHKVLCWFQDQGIYSLQSLLDIYLCNPTNVQNAKYELDDHT